MGLSDFRLRLYRKRVRALGAMRREITNLPMYARYSVPFLRSVIPSVVREWSLLRQARAEQNEEYTSEAAPLISVSIATFNRGPLLAERTLPSVLRQTYQNFEVNVVGDGCTDDTENRIAALADHRVRFINLAQRGPYPENPRHRWMVAGLYPIHRAYDESKGTWIAHLDDDDVWENDHLERMLRFAHEHNHEFVYSKFERQISEEKWITLGHDRFWSYAACSHSTVLFRTYLRLFRCSIHCWKTNLPADLHLYIRMALAGVRAGFLNEVTAQSPLRPGTSRADLFAEDRE